jgi:hypothetical protein
MEFGDGKSVTKGGSCIGEFRCLKARKPKSELSTLANTFCAPATAWAMGSRTDQFFTFVSEILSSRIHLHKFAAVTPTSTMRGLSTPATPTYLKILLSMSRLRAF